jgi:DNA repair exonuclease SbcCD nuclease subunit
MSHGPFRFVHAADFHLELPLFGVTEVPDHLRELFLEAPYSAAERVFQTALAEEADFLVLSGDILDPLATGPRGPLFLVDQFRKLAEREVPVYWAGGRVDPPDSWLPSVRLPENVHILHDQRRPEIVFHRGSDPLVRLTLAGRLLDPATADEDLELDSDHPRDLFTVAVSYGSVNPESLKTPGVDYWALGGKHARQTLKDLPGIAHYPGTPQGRQPQETGPHGCTLVRVDRDGQVHTTQVPTAGARWETERVVVDETTTRQRLESMLHERMQAVVRRIPGTDLLVTWNISGNGPLLRQLRRGALTEELLGKLRDSYGFGPPAAWSISLGVEASAVLPPEWYEQETIRGDFLRAVRHLQAAPDEPVELEPYLSEDQMDGPLWALAAIDNRPVRERVLREAALLGADLLSGEGPQS